MSWRCAYDMANDFVRVQAEGHLSEDELVLGVTCITVMPDFHSDIRVLFDFFHVSSVAVHADALVVLARHPAFSSKSKRAFVTKRGMIRGFFGFHEVYSRPGPSRVFDSSDEAIAWLNEVR